MEMTEHIKCPICHGESASYVKQQPEDYEYFFKPARDFCFYDCLACGTRFIFPRPSEEEVISFYPEDYWAYNKEQTKLLKSLLELRLACRVRKMQKMAGRNDIRLFDVGTGDCTHFDAMKEKGDFVFSGVEINPKMVAIARSKGYNVEQGTLESMDISHHEGQFDIVTMYHLIEHAVEPYLLLEKACALLRPGGYLLGQLPFMRGLDEIIFGRYWSIYHYPRHLQIPSRQGLENLLKKTGFGDVSFRAAISLDTALSIQNFLIGRLGYRPKMTFGKVPLFNTLFMATVPLCLIEYMFNQSSVMDIKAVK